MKITRVDMQNLRTVELDVRNGAVEDYRLDVYVTKRVPGYSRTLVQKLIKDGHVSVNGKAQRPSYEITVGDHIVVNVPKLIEPQMEPEDIPLDVVYEDDYLLAINKSPRFVVHPAAGHWDGTLVNALLHHCGVLAETDDIYRPGIVHRLDKDTSGVILAAKTIKAHGALTDQFENRTIEKEYRAIVWGETRFDSDVIDAPLGRDEHDREKMAVRKNGKPASTFYKALERFAGYTYVACFPKTGRTHQIRVHLAHIGHPIVADSLYGGKDAVFSRDLCAEGDPAREETDPLICRQALHAFRICFTHPVGGAPLECSAPLPEDMESTLAALRKWKARPRVPEAR